ncbi:hypothetical protein SAMN05892883_1305 [Jatrophihabitans sp. GAS493]|uniref:NAD(P)-binding protein n=1 Tax=Jatrophihabitans sp. GAS493 TaxID=1907575 RepID=UPI000BB9B0D7|nr:FAD/NAD(P)-binding protein [Jatrophihabitans sp. GAS493]SOD71840.1 hypothetical protein SAMN05892883_1305 [Jatrophihabitans sp. GAS493]
MTERIVVGSSIASLVAADRLAAAGEPVRLLVDRRPPGGGFGSMRLDGRVLELGVRLLELSYEQSTSTPPLSSYVPGPAGHRHYVSTISTYLSDLVGDRLVQVARPQMLFNGRVVDDLYFTTDAAALREALSDTERAAIRCEAMACWRGMGDPAGLLAADTVRRLDQMTLGDASFVNHGETFHRLFMEPMAEKFVAGGCTDVIAALRRKIWLPLFWPQTLAQAAGDEKIQFAVDRPFHSVAGGGAGEVVAELLARLATHGVRPEQVGALTALESLPNGATRIGFADGLTLDADYPVIGAPAGQLFAAVGAEYTPDSARTVISWLEVADDDLLQLPSLLNIVDSDVPAIRISSGGVGSPGHSVLTVELRHDTPEVEIVAAARKSVERAAILRAGAEMVELRSGAVNSFPLPTHANSLRFGQAATAVDHANLNAEIVGAGLQFGADALGEQIVQGLRAAEALSR